MLGIFVLLEISYSYFLISFYFVSLGLSYLISFISTFLYGFFCDSVTVVRCICFMFLVTGPTFDNSKLLCAGYSYHDFFVIYSLVVEFSTRVALRWAIR